MGVGVLCVRLLEFCRVFGLRVVISGVRSLSKSPNMGCNYGYPNYNPTFNYP